MIPAFPADFSGDQSPEPGRDVVAGQGDDSDIFPLG